MRNLRIAHVADTHLGYRTGSVKGRDEDFAHSWVSACQAIVDSKPDLIVHAGDVFHHPHPSWSAVVDFLEGSSILEKANVPIFVISGNHDSSRVNLKRTIFSVLTGVVPYATICHDPIPMLHRLDLLQAEIVLVSHRALIHPDLEENLLSVISEMDESKFSILVSHGSVGDLDKSTEMGSVVVPDFLFDYPWSYVALGHLHIAQPAGKTGWYSGSIERCGWSDYPAEPAWTLTTLDHEKPLRHSQQAVPHLRMVQLPDLDCEIFSDSDVSKEIMRLIHRVKLGQERALLRITLKGISNYRMRGLSTSTRRQVNAVYPEAHIQLVTEGTSILHGVDRSEMKFDKMLSIEEMFEEFVSKRNYPDGEFGVKFLSQGMEYIAQVRQEDIEKDTGDERTEPAG